MRRLLATLPPAAALLLAPAVHAATTISGSQATPEATSTAGDLSVTGAIAVTGTTPAVTLDSDNSVTNSGALSVKDVSGSTGLLILGGHTGEVANSGSITVNESYTAADSANSDSILEAPFASGSGRYGVRLTGSDPFTGSILSTGTITVQGNGSYGVSLEAPLAGSLTSGTITLTGDNGVALHETGGIADAVAVSGVVTAKGQSSVGADFEGDIGGRLSVSSAVTSTGYATITRPTGTSLSAVQGTAADVEQGGSALVVGGNVAGGVFIAELPTGTVSGSTADVDGDGVADGSATLGSVITYGSAPAMIVGGAGRAISLGEVGGGDLENATQPANAYALLNRGNIEGLGVYDGVSTTGLQIGGQSGSSVSLAGGVRNVGIIEASSYAADATAVVIGAGAAVPEFRNEATTEAIVSGSTAANTATALSIAAGGQVSTLTNTGSLLATVTGDSASAVVVRDAGGSLSTVLNEGAITAAVSPLTAGTATTGSKIALDLSANTTGVSLTQQINPSPTVVYGSTSGSAATATSTATAIAPSITGDVLLGSGDDTVRLLSGAMTGALAFATGADSFTLDGGVSYRGALSYTGSGLALNVTNGTLTDLKTGAVNLSSLTVGAQSTLVFALDPAAGTATRFVVSGAASFAPGASIGFTTLSALTSPQSYVVVSSPSLTITSTSLTTAPYLLVASLAADTTAGAGTLTLDVRRRTAAELGFNAGEAAAYDAVYAALPRDDAVQSLLFAANDRATLVKRYDRLLPDYSGGVFDLLDQASRQLAAASLQPDVDNPGAARLWTQEFVLGSRQEADRAAAYTTTGLGVAGGAETGQSVLGALGVDVEAEFGQARTADAGKVDIYGLQGGLYWRAVYGGLQLGARFGGGYHWMRGERGLSGDDATGTAFTRTATGKWNAYSLAGDFGASYQLTFGRFFVRPQARFDYFRLSEGSYAETGGGDAFDLDVASRDGDEASSIGSAAAGWTFGSGPIRWKPEIEVGVRDVLHGDAGSTTARFTSGGDSFTLLPNTIQGAGVVARAAFTVESDVFRLGVEAGGEDRKDRLEGTVLVRAKALF